jgi:phosphoribosylanthranilate isomerase
MLVKICGIKTIEAATVAGQAGADLIGFVFAPSKRKITPTEAAKIARKIPISVRKVGVFVNETVENMRNIAEQVGLDIIQLHGDEPPEILEQLPYQTIKAFSIDQVNAETIKSFPADYYLIDSPIGKHRGGTGKTFDWNLATELELDPSKLILAGGLSSENVQAAIELVNPAGIDVSSGVETNGKKDHQKIKQFIENAKG